MRNHTDVLIPHTRICVGASQILLMAELIPKGIYFRPVAKTLRNGDYYDKAEVFLQ